MTVKVAQLRGINVGGRNSLPMKELRTLLEELGCRDVTTYIQSGNVVFRSDEPDESLSSLVTGVSSSALVWNPLY